MMISRDIVEHEASHAVAAMAFGVRVREVEVLGDTPGTAGSCAYRSEDWFPAGSWGGLWLERCAAAIAPQVWAKEFAPRRLVARGVDADNALVGKVLLAALPARPDPLHVNQLRRRATDRAREVLTGREAEVMAFADGLARHGIWTAAGGFGGRSSGHIRRAVRPAGCTLNRLSDRPRPVMRPSAPRPVRSRAEEARIAFMLDLRDKVQRRLLTPAQADMVCRDAGYATQIRLKAS